MSASLALTASDLGFTVLFDVSRCTELTADVLPPFSPKLWPSLFPDERVIVPQASPAAFDAAGGLCQPDIDLGDLDGRLPSFPGLSVVSMRPFLSGLGVLDLILDGISMY